MNLSLGVAALLALALGAVPAIDLMSKKWHERSEDHAPVVATADETRLILQAILEEPDSALLQGIPPPPPEPGDPPRPEIARILILADTTGCFEEIRGSECSFPPRREIVSRSLESLAPRNMLSALVAANASTKQVDLKGISHTQVVRSQIIRQTIENGWWPGFYQNYPDTSGFARITRPVLSADRKQALIYISHHCDGLCGSGRIHALVHSGSGWKVTESKMLWLS